ncbi:aldo/keto reductase [Agromyces sp. H3Y2-19a]|uniref:aldo/keto reductase n=1 Tax=Agromyces chromiiresistens TaxID=3030835 RepID=UPI0023B90AE4|nr:aldo/keto reductase [Agromyces chromiiresistens]MDF0514877.1 aldo/keto reductase [Agromyces chromiiresistens]
MSGPFTAERLGPLGYGAASIGNLYREVSDDDARAAVDAAWESGVRYFDTAPHYGLGLSERRLGEALRDRPRDEFVVSTKVGRVLDPNPDFSGGDDMAFDFAVPDRTVRRFDPGEAGIRRSIEDSLERLGIDRIDIAYLHDPDAYDLDRGLAEGLPALARLREEGVVGAIGIGTNSADAAARAVREGDLDLVMIAGRYTLLEQPALAELLPLCSERGVGVVAAAVFNSGLLATSTPVATARYDYGAVPPRLLERARRLAAACEAEGVELPVAAIQYPLQHPAVRAVVVGSARAADIAQNARRVHAPLPDGLWSRLREEGLIP